MTADAERTILCELKNVGHAFNLPSGQCLKVLDQINLAVREHEVLALLGPSGCGKSTILRIFAGLIVPAEGAVLADGKQLQGLNPHVSMVFQSFALYPWMTARENIQAVLLASGMTHAQAAERTEQVIKLVGLSGFANAYPRELSGGMKQRIGIARAVAVDRPLLFMDEPFSQVDALTAESLRSEVLDLWAPIDRNPSSVVMVSHDIKEVVYMADRIVVLGANPGRIQQIVENRLPRPRDYRSPEFLRLVDSIHDLITGHEMPDTAAAGSAAESQEMEPLPAVLPSEIVGLVEYLQARRGHEDMFRIAADTGREFGFIIAVIKGAEILDLVDTPKRQVVLTAEGSAFARAVADERREQWRQRLLGLRLFRTVRDLIARQGGNGLSKDIVLETIVLTMPHEDHEAQFNTMLQWSRFGDLFVYDEASEMLTLAASSAPAAGPAS